MAKPRPNHAASGIARYVDNETPSRERSPLEENVEAIKQSEKAVLLARSRSEQFSDWIARMAGSGPVLVLHVIWFGAWIALNAGVIRIVPPFDPFPYPFLTMAVFTPPARPSNCET